jgi:site-specific recombinase XerD
MAMSPLYAPVTIAEKYDNALHYARDDKLPEDQPRPQPTSAWPPENLRLLEQYVEWLLGGGTSEDVTRRLYLPMAGHVLGLFLKPHDQLDIDRDLQPAMDYILAKQLSESWEHSCKIGLDRFRRFLLQVRGIDEETAWKTFAPDTEGLPTWLVRELERYQQIQQRNWRPARIDSNIRRFWSGYLRLWRFLCRKRGVVELADIQRRYLYDYTEERLKAGYAITGINTDLRNFRAFLVFLQEQDYPVPQALLRVPTLKKPDRLPRFLTDEQVNLLRNHFEERAETAQGAHRLRDALLDRAIFYLLWQGGLRIGELEELLLEDLVLESRKLTVRKGKGEKDRTVYLTETVVAALQTYLSVRGQGPTDHVFLFRNLPLKKDLARDRIKAGGRRVGVKVYPHRLRHTCATQLLNAGCRLTSIQRFLGHRELQSTLVYARVHDHVVAEDYYTAMAQVEQRIELASQPGGNGQTHSAEELVALLDSLRKSKLDTTQVAAVLAVREGILAMANGKEYFP